MRITSCTASPTLTSISLPLRTTRTSAPPNWPSRYSGGCDSCPNARRSELSWQPCFTASSTSSAIP